MSIIIKGINLPKEGRLKLEITSDGLVWIDKGKDFYAHTDYATQIPTPHGRLIDRDDIYIGRWDIDSDLAEQIQNAPTILEEEP